jgi:hypothetical protein
MINVLIMSAFGLAIVLILWWILTVGGPTTYRYDGISVNYGVYNGDLIDKKGKITLTAHSIIVDGVIYKVLDIGRNDESGMIEYIKVERHTSVWTYWIK